MSMSQRRFTAGLAALAVLFTIGAGITSPVVAAGGADGGPFGLKPVPAAKRPLRSYFDLTVWPGGSAQDRVILSNSADTAQRLRIRVSNGVTATNSGTAYRAVPGECGGPSCWVTGLPAAVALGPGERKVLKFRVAVPAGVPAGQYLAGITAESMARPAVQVGTSDRASAQAIVVRQVTVGVAVTTGVLDRLSRSVAIWQVTAAWAGRTPRLYIPVHNSGETFTKATGTASCEVRGRQRSFDVIMETVLPRTGAVLTVNAPGLTEGSLPCVIRLRDATGRTAAWSGDVHVPERTREKTVHTGEGAFTTLPVGTVPLWAVTLLALGGVILTALLALLYLRYHRRRA